MKSIKSKISYLESEPDSNFAINLPSIFDPIFSESNSESDESESDLVQCLWIQKFAFFSAYIYNLLNKLADYFFYLFS